MALAVFLLLLMPFLLIDVMHTALERLHLSPPVAMMAVIWIFLGSLINVPVQRIAREEEQPIELIAVLGFWGPGWTPRLRRVRRDTTIAVNLGGCVIPSALTVWEVLHVLTSGGWPLLACAVVIAANVAVCYRVARPVEGVGIAMPGLVSPLVAVGLTSLLLPAEYDALRAPVAFAGGVLGPLVGTDLLHLKDLSKISVGVLSIGGAGTFDGIVLSGVLAALLA
jgi:uncharacterized membrane protein